MCVHTYVHTYIRTHLALGALHSLLCTSLTRVHLPFHSCGCLRLKLQPIKKEIASYHSKLESLTPPPVDMETARKGTSPQAEGDASIEDQAVALKSQWEWILKQSIERREVVEEVIGQLEQFEPQYTALNQFMVDGQEQLSKEKPIGGLPQRIREQLETCKVHFLTKWCVRMSEENTSHLKSVTL